MKLKYEDLKKYFIKSRYNSKEFSYNSREFNIDCDEKHNVPVFIRLDLPTYSKKRRVTLKYFYQFKQYSIIFLGYYCLNSDYNNYRVVISSNQKVGNSFDISDIKVRNIKKILKIINSSKEEILFLFNIFSEDIKKSKTDGLKKYYNNLNDLANYLIKLKIENNSYNICWPY